ncbi:ABC-three component system protein [Pontibacter actiniarum]|uniref:ABC-three component systems C-terminal domain-containing protein n=1 Tax=Pontibacter actiniarum TaxID=323450 RepID=A0A1X9YSE5_9BACT|nr:ABC-three component system protein [Pontibacter actiniarum]ARS35816.1 hypothetical protein CA264_10380 [Pontibacter actiniarum]
MSKLTDHAAPGQALGYYFQLERALSWLSKADAGATVGIETEDDVVLTLISGEKIYEQDKSSTSSYPFHPSRKDFWKTLNIWLTAIKEGAIDIYQSSFYMVTNKVDDKALAKEIGDAQQENEIIECINKIREAGKSPSETTKTMVNSVLSFTDKELAALISKINYADGSKVFGTTLREQLISDLHLDNDEFAEGIINELYGWVYSQVVDAWRERKLGLVERDAFIRQKNNAIKTRTEQLFNDSVIDVSKVGIGDTEAERGSGYVRQLQIINCTDDEIIDAIHDYIRSSIRKTYLSQKGYCTPNQLKEMEKQLAKRWKHISKRLVIENKKNNHCHEDLGQLILLETLNENVKIGSVQTTDYVLSNGTYHYLANSLVVGWHPDYTKLLS